MSKGKPATYARLRTSIQNTLADGHLRAQKAVERERVRTYWKVGDHLVKFLDANPKEYGGQVMKQLAGDLGLRVRLLYEIVSFRQSTPKVPSRALLSWSHYRRLLGIQDESLRDDLLIQAEQNRWTVKQLTEQIALAAFDSNPSASGSSGTRPLAAKRGEPYLYRLLDKPNLGLVLDQGFKTLTKPPMSLPRSAQVGQVFHSVPAGRGYRLEPYRKARRAWTYAAWLDRIVDGDTLDVTLDLGFGNFIEERLRLRGINTPEMDTAEGRRAKDFVVNAIGHLNRIVISTTKVDKYDRYLADVLYVDGKRWDVQRTSKEGRYLNRELIEAGLAERY